MWVKLLKDSIEKERKLGTPCLQLVTHVGVPKVYPTEFENDDIGSSKRHSTSLSLIFILNCFFKTSVVRKQKNQQQQYNKTKTNG